MSNTPNIGVQVSANISQFVSALNQATSQLQRFSTQASRLGASGTTGLRSMGQQMQNVAAHTNSASMGFGRMGAASRSVQNVLNAINNESGIFHKFMAGFTTYGGQVATLAVGFNLANESIQAFYRGLGFIKDSFLSLDAAVTQSTSIMLGDTTELKRNLTDVARTVSSELAVSAADVAKGFYYLASAGLDANTALAVTPVAARYAQAGLMDLDKATEQLMDVTHTFHMVSDDATKSSNENARITAENVEHVGDIIARASIESNARIDQIATALQGKAGSTATFLKQSLEEATSAIETFATVGIKGATAGTYYSMALRDLSTKALKNEEAFRQLGVEVYDTHGNMNQLSGTIDQLAHGMANMTTEQKKQTLMQMGLTDRSIQATIALVEQNVALQAFVAQKGMVSGALKEISEKQMEAWSKKIQLLTQNLQNLSSEMVEGFLGVLKQVGDKLSPLGESLGKFFDPFMAGAKDSVKIIGGALATIGSFGLSGLSAALSPVISRVAELTTLIRVLGTVAVAHAATKFYDWFKNSTMMGINMQIAMESVSKSIRGAASSAIGAVRNILTNVGGINGMGNKLRYIWESGTLAVNGLKGAVSGFAKSAISGLKSLLTSTEAWSVAIMLAFQAWQNGVAEGKKSADELISKVTEGLDENTYDGLVKAAQRMVVVQNQAVDGAREWNNETTGFMERFGQMASTVGSWFGHGTNYASKVSELDTLNQKTAEYNKTLTGVNVLIKNLGDGYNKMGNQVMIAATRIGLDFGKIATGEVQLTQKNLEDIKTTISAIQVPARIAAEEVGGVFDESDTGMTRYVDNVEKIKKGLVDLFVKIADPVESYKKVMMDVVNLQDIFTTLTDKLTSDNKKALEEQKTLVDRNTQARIDQLEAVRDAQVDAIEKSTRETRQGIKDSTQSTVNDIKDSTTDQVNAIASGTSKTTKATTDQKTAIREGSRDLVQAEGRSSRELTDAAADAAAKRKKQIQDSTEAQIKAIREGAENEKKAIDERDQKVRPNAKQLFDATGDQIKVYETYKEKISKLAGMNGVDAPMNLVEYFSKMKPEDGEKILDDVLSKGNAFVAQFEDYMKRLKDLQKPSWRVTSDAMLAHKHDMEKFQNNIVQLTALYPHLATQIKAMASQLGDDNAPAAVAELLEMTAKGQRSDVNDYLQQWKNASEAHVSDVVKSMDSLTDVIGAAATGDSAKLEETLKNLPANWNQILMNSGIDSATLTMIEGAVNAHLDKFEEGAKKRLREMVTNLGGIVAGVPDAAKNSLLEGIGNLNTQGKIVIQQTVNLKPNPTPAGKQHMIAADGGIFKYATGGFENHIAQISNRMRLWAEPETGGEAYIPLSVTKRARSTEILSTVASMFGYALMEKGRSNPGERAGMTTTSKIAPVAGGAPSYTNVKHAYNFYGPIQGVNMEDALAFAERKKRQEKVINR